MDYDEVIDVRGLAYRLCAEFGRADDAATMDALRGPMNLAYRTASEAVWSDPDNAAHVRGHGLSASWVSAGRQGEANPYQKGMASAEVAGRAMLSVIDAGQRAGVTESSCGNCGHVRSCHEDDECWADITPVGEGSYEQCPCGWWDDPDASEPPRQGRQEVDASLAGPTRPTP
jgi:hypothetical protein